MEIQTLESRLYTLIDGLYKDMKSMRPEDGFSSPRDIKLVAEVNKKSAILKELQEAMRVINPEFDIRR